MTKWICIWVLLASFLVDLADFQAQIENPANAVGEDDEYLAPELRRGVGTLGNF